MANIVNSIYSVKLSKDELRVVGELGRLCNKKHLASHYDYAEIAGTLLGVNVITGIIEGVGGYCDIWKNEIAISSDEDLSWERSVLCHELGHVIQAKTGHYDNRSKLLSDIWQEEQAADRIGLEVHRILYPNLNTYWPSYFSSDNKQFLIDYYKDEIENDLN